MRLTPGLEHTGSTGYGGGTTGTPKEPPAVHITRKTRTGSAAALSSVSSAFEGPTEGGAPARSQGVHSLEMPTFPLFNAMHLLTPLGKRVNTEPT